MPTNVVKARIGVPGPPGGGVTPAELAGLMPKTGGIFTGIVNFRKTQSSAVVFETDGQTALLVIDTSNGDVEVQNGNELRGFSDAGSTETYNLNASTGNAQFDGTVTVGGGRVVSDTLEWGFVIDNAGSAITTGVKIDYPVPYNCKITAWEIVADQSGSIVVDIWSDSYANFPPTVADTITTSEKPTLSAAQKNTDTSLNSGNGWTLTKGNWLRFNVDSITTCTRVTIKLSVTRL